jgi:hypothetical protein
MRTLIAVFAVALMSAVAIAHEKPVKGPHGGQLIHVDDAHYELVAKDNELTLFVSDNDTKPRPSLDGSKATATVLVDGKTVTVTLVPDKTDTLAGKGTFAATKALRVVVSIQETGRKSTQIRFTPVMEP